MNMILNFVKYWIIQYFDQFTMIILRVITLLAFFIGYEAGLPPDRSYAEEGNEKGVFFHSETTQRFHEMLVEWIHGEVDLRIPNGESPFIKHFKESMKQSALDFEMTASNFFGNIMPRSRDKREIVRGGGGGGGGDGDHKKDENGGTNTLFGCKLGAKRAVDCIMQVHDNDPGDWVHEKEKIKKHACEVIGKLLFFCMDKRYRDQGNLCPRDYKTLKEVIYSTFHKQRISTAFCNNKELGMKNPAVNGSEKKAKTL